MLIIIINYYYYCPYFKLNDYNVKSIRLADYCSLILKAPNSVKSKLLGFTTPNFCVNVHIMSIFQFLFVTKFPLVKVYYRQFLYA